MQSQCSKHIPLSFVVPAKHSAPVAIDEDMVAVLLRVCEVLSLVL